MNLESKFVKRTDEKGYDGRVGIYLSYFDNNEYNYPILIGGDKKKIHINDYPKRLKKVVFNLKREKYNGVIIHGLSEDDIMQLPGDIITFTRVFGSEYGEDDRNLSVLSNKYFEYTEHYKNQFKNIAPNEYGEVVNKVIDLFQERVKNGGEFVLKPWAVAALVDPIENDPELIFHYIELMKQDKILESFADKKLFLSSNFTD